MDLAALKDSAARRTRLRMVVSALLGTLTGLVSWLIRPEHSDYAVILGWSVAATVFVARTWWLIAPMDAAATARHADVDEASARVEVELIVLLSSVASLVAVGYLLLGGSGHDRVLRALLGTLAVVVSWVQVHTVYTLRYARLYYSGTDGGIDFPGDEPPRYSDFAYLAFTLGMTYQVSDTNLQGSRMRSAVLGHCLLSYLFGVVVVASTVNIVIGLAG